MGEELKTGVKISQALYKATKGDTAMSDDLGLQQFLLNEPLKLLTSLLHNDFLAGRFAGTRSSGDEESNIKRGVWIKGTAGFIKKDARSLNNFLLGGGFDIDLNDNGDMIGVSYSHVISKLKLGIQKINGASHIFSLYGQKSLAENFWLDTTASISSIKLQAPKAKKPFLESTDFDLIAKLNYSLALKNFAIEPNIGIKYLHNMSNKTNIPLNEAGNISVNNILESNNEIAVLSGITLQGPSKSITAQTSIKPKIYVSAENHFTKKPKLKSKLSFYGHNFEQSTQLPKTRGSTILSVGAAAKITRNNIEVDISYSHNLIEKSHYHVGSLTLRVMF